VALSDDLASVTKYMLSLAEDPQQLEAFQADPTVAIQAAELTPGARTLLTSAGGVEPAALVIIIVVIVIRVGGPKST
jgi:hypothetical protein